MKAAEAKRLVDDLGLVPVTVEGWGVPAWAAPELLETGTAGLRSRPVLVSPFDSLVWDRNRTERVFSFRHRLEAYTPKHQRVHGYFSMPLLVGNSLVGLVDPGREGTTFVAKGVHVDPDASKETLRGLAIALQGAASWVGSEAIRVDWVTPAERRDDVLAAVQSTRGTLATEGPAAGSATSLRDHVADRPADDDVGDLVTGCWAAVHDHDRFAEVAGERDDAGDWLHLERRADGKEQVGLGNCEVGALEVIRVERLAEAHGGRLQDPSALLRTNSAQRSSSARRLPAPRILLPRSHTLEHLEWSAAGPRTSSRHRCGRCHALRRRAPASCRQGGGARRCSG